MDLAEEEEFIRLFHENKLHVAVKEWKMEQTEEMIMGILGGEDDREECYYCLLA